MLDICLYPNRTDNRMTTKYDILRNHQYRHHPSLIVSHRQQIDWKTKPKRINIWFLVYYHHQPGYNIEVRTWYNDERYTLSKLVKMVHSDFMNDMKNKFIREQTQTYKHKEAIHLVAIEPVEE